MLPIDNFKNAFFTKSMSALGHIGICVNLEADFAISLIFHFTDTNHINKYLN